jgi:putative membrane protein
MIRYLRYLVVAAVTLALLTVALANRGTVELRLLPEALAALTGFSFAMQVPLFLVLFGAIAIGIAVGFTWEWAREHKHRATASRSTREVKRLEREIAVMKDATSTPRDEVLALLDAPPRKAG